LARLGTGNRVDEIFFFHKKILARLGTGNRVDEIFFFHKIISFVNFLM